MTVFSKEKFVSLENMNLGENASTQICIDMHQTRHLLIIPGRDPELIATVFEKGNFCPYEVYSSEAKTVVEYKDHIDLFNKEGQLITKVNLSKKGEPFKKMANILVSKKNFDRNILG